jgi:hypothetical protein
MQRINNFFCGVFLVIVLVLAPISPLNFIVHSQTIDEYGNEHITGYEEWTTDKSITSYVSIDEGATLVIKKGVTITFDGGGVDVYGSLIIAGTLKDNVKLRKSDGAPSYSIAVDGGKIVMRNTDMSGAGASIQLMKGNSIINAVNAFYNGGIKLNSGSLDAEGCDFHDNDVVMFIGDVNSADVKVNRSTFENNAIADVVYRGDGDSLPNFQYNWWGDANGPQQKCYSGQSCYYEKIDGDIDFSNFLPEKSFHDPVVIVPGIFGSWEKDGKLQLDPVFHTYDNLYTEFANNGYVPDKDLFIFPYEWRDSNIENAKKLKSKIAEIKIVTNWPKVDVVAHSMGGLLVREYIESDYYQGDVDQLVTLATPNLGAPESYMKWDGDGWFFSLVDIFMKHIVTQEAEEGGFADRFDYMHNRPIASLQELLPVYDYLYEADNGYDLKSYPIGYPHNEFLEKLNNNALKLTSAVEYDKIIGNTKGKDTISGINVVSADMGKYWVDGYPLGFEVFVGDRGIRYDAGDVTVPLSSSKSENVPSDNLIELPSDHRSIVTDAQKDVLELLTTIRPDIKVESGLIKNIFITQVFSPIDIQVIAPDGKRVGKDFVTGEVFDEIEGAYYSGYATENEFLTIPNPIDGEYKILTQGTGEGDFKVETTEISEQEDGSAQESTVALVGKTTPDAQKAFTVEVAGETVIDPTVQNEVQDEQDSDSQDIQEEQEPVIEENQEVVAESSHEKKTEKHQQESSKEDDNQLAIVESSEPQVSGSNDSRDENSIVANLKNGFDKLSQDIELAKTAQAEEVIKKNSETGSGSGKIVFEIFASLIAVFVARKGLIFFLTKV